MFVTEFPDLQWLKGQAEKRFADGKRWKEKSTSQSGWPNVVLNVKSGATIRDDIRGPLSLFTNFDGTSRVTAGNKSVQVKPGFFFLTNHDQHYTLEIEKSQKAETCNVHFCEYFTDQVWQSLMQSPENLLDQPFHVPQERMEFFSKLYPLNEGVTRILRELCTEQYTSSLGQEEKLYELVTVLLSGQQELIRKQYLLSPVKRVTRIEIMRRLAIATDIIYSSFGDEISLDLLARESGLSKFHFLRLFTEAFDKTPHQFINEVRITRAKALLSARSCDIKTIAQHVGFSNPSSFSRLFYQNVGVYPTVFAQQAYDGYRHTTHTPEDDNRF